jgi:hypothetical protein
MIDDHGQTPPKNSVDFLERLQRYPQLQAKFEALLDVVENASGDVVKAHEAEQRVFEELRQIGQDALQAWAERKHQKLSTSLMRALISPVSKKKLHWQTRFGKIQVQEQTYRRGRKGPTLRPFCEAAGVGCRSYSLGLERALSDFGADQSFAKAVAKVKEHYGIEVPASGVRQVTYKHAQGSKQQAELETGLPAKGAWQVIAETDGCLIPVVKIDPKKPAKDRRKQRQLQWREARLSLARGADRLSKHYRATLAEVEQAGAQLVDCVVKAGGGRQTRIHCVGDGAPWIVRQVEQQFKGQATYLIDFYHLSQYLAKAAEGMGADEPSWLHKQQARLKANRSSEVLKELADKLESDEVSDEQAPVRGCVRYIKNRLAYLDYQGALAGGLPIGSGEVESGHRSVIQARLKLSGAWWKEENAEHMLALRTLRASGEWQSYWDKVRQAAA